MDLLTSDLIRPFEEAEHSFLQVLLSRFSLSKQTSGAQLEVQFDEATPGIHPSYLPRPLLLRKAIQYDPNEHETKLQELVIFING